MGEQRLALALRYLRLRAQLTQEAVCEKVRASGGEISAIYLSMLERGQRNPSPPMLDPLLAVLDSNRTELAQLYQDEPWSDTCHPRPHVCAVNHPNRPQPPPNMVEWGRRNSGRILRAMTHSRNS